LEADSLRIVNKLPFPGDLGEKLAGGDREPLVTLIMFKKILFPIHHSREAQTALKVVVDIVEAHHSELVLLVVADTTVIDAAVVGEETSTTENLGAVLAAVQAKLAEHSITAEVLQREGKPAFTICDVADEINADLIAMGSRGLDDEHASESVTSRVIGLSPCPILVVP
jgi:nucleotide-binding universal stress UspA family protein